MTPSEEKDVREAADYVRGALAATMIEFTQVPPAVLRTILAALQSAEQERDEARRMAMSERAMCDSVMRYRDEYLARAEAAEAQLAGVVEAAAQAVYEQWSADWGFVRWVPGGNSEKQDEARRIIHQALASITSTAPVGENHIGAAELAVGQFVYRRIETLMDAKAGTPEGGELAYLAELVGNVEEYGARGDEEGELWRDAHFALPAQDVGGLEAGDLEWLRATIDAQRLDIRIVNSGIASLRNERINRIDRIIAALSNPQGERPRPPHPDVARLVEALAADWFDQVEDLLDDYSDAEIIDGTTHPNKAMRLLCQLRDARP